LNLDGSFFESPLAAGATQRGGDLGLRKAPTEHGRRGDGQHGEGVSGAEFIEGRQGRRVELPQRRTKLVQLPLAAPDQALVSSGQHFHHLGEVAVPSDGPVVMAISPGEFGQDPGVTRVGLRSRRGVALPIAGGRHRVDRQHGVSRRHHRSDEQAPIGFGGNHHLCRFLHERRHQLVKSGHPLDPSGNRPLARRFPWASATNTSWWASAQS